MQDLMQDLASIESKFKTLARLKHFFEKQFLGKTALLANLVTNKNTNARVIMPSRMELAALYSAWFLDGKTLLVYSTF